jgi:hypothetical protein
MSADAQVGLIFGGMLVLVMAGAALLVSGMPAAQQREAFRVDEVATAKNWADRTGLRITGVTCDGYGRCTIVPETGQPFAVRCGRQGAFCEVETCK